MTASPKMDDDWLSREQIEQKLKRFAKLGLATMYDMNPTMNYETPWTVGEDFTRYIASMSETVQELAQEALSALESRSEVLEEGYRQGYFDAAAGKKPSVSLLKSHRAEPGAPSELGRDDDCVRRDFERGVIERAEREPNAAEQASPSVAPAESNSEFAAGPASAAPEPAAPQVPVSHDAGQPTSAHSPEDRVATPVVAAAPDVKGIAKRLREYRCADPWAGSLMLEAAALLESAHARVDSWPAFTSFYNQGLEEAAKVCEECRVLIIGDPIEQGAVMIARETGHDLARQIRAKIKPARGET